MAVVFLQKYFPLPYHSLGKDCWGVLEKAQTFTVRHWTNSRWYIWVLQCQLFLLSNHFLNRGHHTEITICDVICQLPPYHWHCKWYGTSFVIHPSIDLWWKGHEAHVQSPALVLVYFISKVQEV